MQPRVRWMVTLVLLALAARLGAALTLSGGFHFADEAVYADAAQRLSSGGGFARDYSNVPGYPVFLLMLSLGLPASQAFLRVGQAAVSALGCLGVFALADRMFGRRVAILAGLVYALDPLVVISSALLYPETAAAMIVPLVVLAAVAAVDRDALGKSAVAGVLLGILALLRPVALLLPPIVAAWILWSVPVRPARRVAHLGALGLAFLLVLMPWTVRNIRVHGGLVPVATTGTQNAAVGRAEVAREGLVASMVRWVWTDPGAFVSRTTHQFVEFWELTPTRLVTDDPARREELHERDPRLSAEPLFPTGLRDLVSAVTFGLELALALLGLVVCARVRPRQTLLIATIMVAYAIGFALFVVKLRYRIPVLPLLFIFSAVGAAAGYSLVRGTGLLIPLDKTPD